MKIRNGFVSNSSSSSFILDKQEISRETISEISCLPRARGLGRGTACAIGKDAVRYAKEWKEEMGTISEYDRLGAWILEWADKLGEDNVIFVRISDEDGIGDELYVRDLAKAEMEYH